MQYKYRSSDSDSKQCDNSKQIDDNNSFKDSAGHNINVTENLSGEVDEDIHSQVAPSKYDREDHRLTGYRSGATSLATNRLHGHIRKDAKDEAIPKKNISQDIEIDTSNSYNNENNGVAKYLESVFFV